MIVYPIFQSHIESDDILDERNRVYLTSQYILAIRIEDMKKYSGFSLVIKNLSFGVNKQECFGLLGNCLV